MKAILYEKFQGPIQHTHVADPNPEKDGVVIEVKASGLCLSDWHGWMGHDADIVLPHVPGHELAGIIVDVGKEVQKFKVGDRVTVPFVSGCGKCPECQSNNHQICDEQFQPGFTHWGSFAQFVAINYAETNLIKLPDVIDFTTAASLGCRFATSFRGIVDQGQVKPEDWVAVHGCGGVGLSAIMIAKAKGAKVIGVDINENALRLALSIGADLTINPLHTKNVAEEIQDLTNGGAHISLDALGDSEVLLNSIQSLRKKGRHVQIGIMPPDSNYAKIPIDQMIAKELEIVGSHGMQAFRYQEMIDLITLGKLRPEKLVGEEIKLQDVTSLLPSMNQAQATGIKVITTFD